MTTKPPPLPPSTEVSRALRRARRRKNPEEAVVAVKDALIRKEAHTLAPNDLVWLVEKLGGWGSTKDVSWALARWLDHHGAVHEALFEAAVEVARLDNTEWLDDALFVAKPDSYRWLEHAKWVCVYLLPALSSADARPPIKFDPLGKGEHVAELKKLALMSDEHAGYARLARVALEKHGQTARTGLRGARGRAQYGTPVRLLLDLWEEAFA